MSRLLRCLALVVASAMPAAAGTMLFATAATVGRVDGFCLNRDGSIDANPRTSVQTFGPRPSVLLVSPDQKVLMVSENDRVEFFSIGADGKLARAAKVPDPPRKGLNSRDITLSADGTMLYVPERKIARLTAYPLGPDYLPTSPTPTSCILGPVAEDFENLLVRQDLPTPLIYASSSGGLGRVATWPLDAQGNLVGSCTEPDPTGASKTVTVACTGPQACFDKAAANLGVKPAVAAPSSERKNLGGAGPFLIQPTAVGLTPGSAGRLFVHARFAKRIFAFDLQSDGTFGLNEKSKPRQKAATQTRSLLRYQAMVFTGRNFLLSQFFNGRIDAYRVGDDGRLPHAPTSSTQQNVRFSPVGLAVRDGILYVGAGKFDRVQAYHLGPDGAVNDKTPFSETAESTNSFPNAVAFAEVPGVCE
jgi:6-phosphogluconolactonase (cycloisomerase 2 family)